MTCWHCGRVMSKAVDAKREKACDTPNKLHQTEYVCSNCGACYVVTEHEIHGPTKVKFEQNRAHP